MSRMNAMERRMLSEVYRRLVIERARAKSTASEENGGNRDLIRILTEEIIELEMRLNEGHTGLTGLLGK
jgi:hypothetical protein